MITQKLLAGADGKIEFNEFKLYRSDNGIATTIEFNFPNEDGTLGPKGVIEVIDAAYRNISIRFASSSSFDSSLTNFQSKNTNGNWYINGASTISYTAALPSTLTNTSLCYYWRNLSTDLSAKENTNTWMTYSYCSSTGNAPRWCRDISTDGGNWDIPNEFQLMVIFCCSDILDELDPTFSSNKDKGLGYKATNGRFSPSTTYPYIWSSTDYSSDRVRGVHAYGGCYDNLKTTPCGVVPIREKVISTRGFTLYRSENGIATTIEYNWPNSDGTLGERRKMEVIDAAYRGLSLQFGAASKDSANTNLINLSGTMTVTSTNAQVCSMVYNASHEKTAKECCDIWMTYEGTTDSSGISGVPAVKFCRDITAGGATTAATKWQLPNIVQLAMIFALRDTLNAIDPTASANTTKKIGTPYRTWSSSEYGVSVCWCINPDGILTTATKNLAYGVVPIRELS